MTKVTILGQEPKEEKKKQIVFLKEIDDKGCYKSTSYTPSLYNNVILIKSIAVMNMDLMCCFDDRVSHDISNRALYLGHFNDGVV